MASSKEFLAYCLEQLEASLDSSVVEFSADSTMVSAEADMLESSDLRRRYVFTSRKMFGEYCIYVQDFGCAPESRLTDSGSSDTTPAHALAPQSPKPIFLLCDDTLFAKPHKILESILPNHPKAPPYPGAKEWYSMDIDNLLQLRKVIITLTPHLEPAKIKKKHRKQQ